MQQVATVVYSFKGCNASNYRECLANRVWPVGDIGQEGGAVGSSSGNDLSFRWKHL